MKRMTKKIIPLLLSLSVALSFSLIGAEATMAAGADSCKDSAAPVSGSELQSNSTNSNLVNPSAGKGPRKFIKAGSTTYLPPRTQGILMYGPSYTYKTTWLKIKPSSSGSIVFLSAASNTVQLCNAKKRPLSPARIVGDQYTMRTLKDVYFGVKGKTTYYLKLNGSGLRSGQLNQYFDSLGYYNSKSTGKYGKTARRAAKIKRNTYRRGFLLSNSKPKYYTFRKRVARVNLYLPAATDDTLLATVTATAPGMYKFKRTYFLTRHNNGQRVTIYTLSKRKRNMKVTVKISRSGKSSGAFAVKYK